MSLGDSWAQGYKNARIIGTILLFPLLYAVMSFADWMMSDRITLVLTTPRKASSSLDGDIIPKKRADNYSKQGEPLLYSIRIDEGEYTLRVTLDDESASLTQKVVLDRDEGPELYATFSEEDGGLKVEVTH